MRAARPLKAAMFAVAVAASPASPARAQMSTPPGPAVPILPAPTMPAPDALPTGTLKHPATPSAAGATPPLPAPTGLGSLPVSSRPSNITPENTPSAIAPPLPEPPLDENASPAAFLRAARAALLAGKTGEAQEALERAESRALIRAVRPSQVNAPSSQSLVRQIAAARQSLPGGDRAATIALIDAALRSREAGIN